MEEIKLVFEKAEKQLKDLKKKKSESEIKFKTQVM
jgi:hypothetical protein